MLVILANMFSAFWYLNSHGMVFIAYLQTTEIGEITIAGFMSLIAFFSMCIAYMYPAFQKQMGLVATTRWHIATAVVMAIVSVPLWHVHATYIFLIFVALCHPAITGYGMQLLTLN
jgi:hypothetical protein